MKGLPLRRCRSVARAGQTGARKRTGGQCRQAVLAGRRTEKGMWAGHAGRTEEGAGQAGRAYRRGQACRGRRARAAMYATEGRSAVHLRPLLRSPFAPPICNGKRRSGRVLTFCIFSKAICAKSVCGRGCRASQKKCAPENTGRTLCRAVKGMLPALGDQGLVILLKNAVEKMLLAGTKTIGPACRVNLIFAVSLWPFCVRLLQAGHAACRRALSHNSCGPWAASLF